MRQTVALCVAVLVLFRHFRFASGNDVCPGAPRTSGVLTEQHNERLSCRCADFVLLNKMDLLAAGKLQHLTDIVTSLNPLATVRHAALLPTLSEDGPCDLSEARAETVALLRCETIGGGPACIQVRLLPDQDSMLGFWVTS